MKYLRYLFLSLFIISSFYIVEKTASFHSNTDPLIKAIIKYSENNDSQSIDAKIDSAYITPGMYGKRVNKIKSLMKMKSDKVFNSLFLVMDDIKPKISLEDNKDKIITRANSNKKGVSLIIENDETNIITYLISNKIKASLLVNEDSVNQHSFLEQINNDFINYNKVEKLLNKINNNKNICIISRNNKDFCKRKGKYLIEPTYVLNSTNLITIKNNLASGDIILIKDSVLIDDLAYLINYIKSKDLIILYLSELISEK